MNGLEANDWPEQSICATLRTNCIPCSVLSCSSLATIVALTCACLPMNWTIGASMFAATAQGFSLLSKLDCSDERPLVCDWCMVRSAKIIPLITVSGDSYTISLPAESCGATDLMGTAAFSCIFVPEMVVDGKT